MRNMEKEFSFQAFVYETASRAAAAIASNYSTYIDNDIAEEIAQQAVNIANKLVLNLHNTFQP